MFPAVAPIRRRAKTPESGAAVAIWDVELVENSTEPAAAVTIERPTRLIFPLTGIWIVFVDAAASETTIFLFMASNLLHHFLLDKLFVSPPTRFTDVQRSPPLPFFQHFAPPATLATTLFMTLEKHEGLEKFSPLKLAQVSEL